LTGGAPTKKFGCGEGKGRDPMAPAGVGKRGKTWEYPKENPH